MWAGLVWAWQVWLHWALHWPAANISPLAWSPEPPKHTRAQCIHLPNFHHLAVWLLVKSAEGQPRH